MTKADAGVATYVAGQPEEARAALRRVRGIIRRVLPGAEEAISYRIPTYRLEGRYVVYFAGWKRHWSLYPVTERVRRALGPALEGYELRKGTLRFPLGEPVPTRLVERIVRALASAAAERGRAEAKKRVARRPGQRRPGASR